MIGQIIIGFSQRHFASLCLVFLGIGLLIGESTSVLTPAIPWLMSVLMFSSGLGLRLRDLESLRKKPWLLPVTLLMLHILCPLMVFCIASLLPLPLESVMGFVILAVIPVSATGILWAAVYRGNITLGMALLLVDTLAAPFIIPYVLAFFFGAEVHMDPMRMLKGLLWMLFFPSMLALFCNRLSGGAIQRIAGETVAFLAKGATFGILVINGGVVSHFFQNMDTLFFTIFGMTFFFCALWFGITFLAGRLFLSSTEDLLAFMLTLSIRGTTTGMVISMAYFPPLTTLTVAFNMLFQQSLGAWAGKEVRKRYT